MTIEFGNVARDPAERRLAAQRVQTHVRLVYLTMMSTQPRNLKWAAMMHVAADRASNAFRRQTLALAEYRRPPRRARLHRDRAGEHRRPEGGAEQWETGKRKSDERTGMPTAGRPGPTG